MSINNAGFTTETVGSAAALISVPTGGLTNGAIMTVQVDQVAYRLNGVPVAVAGSSTVLNVGDQLVFDSWTTPRNSWRTVMQKVQFIRVTNDATLAIEWFD